MVSEQEKIIEEGVSIQRDLKEKEDEFNRYRLRKQYNALEARARFLGITKEQFRNHVRNSTPKVVRLADYKQGIPVLS